jgi:hypothetical protein
MEFLKTVYPKTTKGHHPEFPQYKLEGIMVSIFRSDFDSSLEWQTGN